MSVHAGNCPENTINGQCFLKLTTYKTYIDKPVDNMCVYVLHKISIILMFYGSIIENHKWKNRVAGIAHRNKRYVLIWQMKL